MTLYNQNDKAVFIIILLLFVWTQLRENDYHCLRLKYYKMSFLKSVFKNYDLLSYIYIYIYLTIDQSRYDKKWKLY
jgi:hypothetical protein